MSDELKTCLMPECAGRTFKTQGALNLHNRKHKKAIVETQSSAKPLEAKDIVRPSKQDKVTFLSPRAHALTLVVKPDYWTAVETPAGSKQIMVTGKIAQFENGRFTTSDPEIIDYLENTYSDKADPRYPVFSMRLMQQGA